MSLNLPVSVRIIYWEISSPSFYNEDGKSLIILGDLILAVMGLIPRLLS